MVSEENKYFAEVYKVIGFAFMAPFGRVILSIPSLKLSDLSFGFLVYTFLSLFLVYVGAIILLKGSEFVIERRNL